MQVLLISSVMIFTASLSAVMAQQAQTETVISREHAPDSSKVQLTKIAGGFNRPLYVTQADDGSKRLFVVEQSGKIWVLKDGVRNRQPFLDFSSRISPSALTNEHTEQGLLGLVFHPNFRANGLFFVNYTDLEGHTAIVRYRVSPEDADLADLASEQYIFQLEQPHFFHNGGHLAFGPDGYLYIAVGDGGMWGERPTVAQNLKYVFGSILRIDVNGAAPYEIPADNPFVGHERAKGEIWSYGLRNPWRFSFDRKTGDMYLGDVGHADWEEVDFQSADSKGGENYGWSLREGTHDYFGGDVPNHVPPFFEYAHKFGCAVVGGYVYRGEAIPDLEAVYLFGDWCTGRIWASWRDSELTWHTEEFLDTQLRISSFGEDVTGELYVLDYIGTLYRIDPVNA